MATTYTLISSNVLSSSAASVSFSAIPSTFTDLVLRISARASNASANNNLRMEFNSDTSTNYSEINVRGNGSAAATTLVSSQSKLVEALNVNADSATANTFGSLELYFPNYASSTNKPMSFFSAQENNSTSAFLVATAALWRNSAALTSIYTYPGASASFMAGSSFYLYGISNA